MSDSQKPKKKFGLLGLPSSTRLPYLILGGTIVLIFLIIIVSSIFKSPGLNTQELIGIATKAQEISRVSTLASQQNAADSALRATAQTTISSLSSDQSQLVAYLSSHGQKVGVKELNAKLDKSTDTDLKVAATNNNLAGFYYGYLKSNLTSYQNDLNSIYKTTPKSGQDILKTAYNSTGIILNSSQIKSAQ
jgi:hypothetical protein